MEKNTAAYEGNRGEDNGVEVLRKKIIAMVERIETPIKLTHIYWFINRRLEE